ncbi:MAG: hypothetical protein HKM93_20970 [Desulfobacteraceae bacterium]|nr:hypothetical protein [Desulfobacteraceae bacterium]
MKTNFNFLLILFVGFAALNLSFSSEAIDLSSGYWETSYDCDTDGNAGNGDTDWLQYSDPLVCDGISKKGSWTANGKYEQILSAANNPDGNGGKGQRHWIGDGTNVNSGSTRIFPNSPPGKFWIRWYQRWESGYGEFGQYKSIYGFANKRNGPLINFFSPTGGMSFEYLASGNEVCSNCGWGTDFYTTGVSDGSWVYVEAMIDAVGGNLKLWVGNSARLVIDASGVLFKDSFVDEIIIGSNQKNVANGREMYIDYDDIAISTTGYIGPINGVIPICGDGTCNEAETCGTCLTDCGACPSICGNSSVESGETCDDGNTFTETCDYGLTNCIVCSENCQNISGTTSFCGDSICDSLNESSENCSADCVLLPPENTSKIEAETATLTSPMTIVSSDLTASNGQYIHTPVQSSGSALYSFNISRASSYKFIANVKVSDDSHNSFYMNFDNTGQKTWDINYNSLPGQFNIWYEDEIRSRGSGNQATPEFNPIIVNLSVGTHTLEISGRESNAQLDYFYLVDLNTQMFIEAESAALTSPMTIVTSDPTASNGQYIHTPAQLSGSALYSFNISHAGSYKIVANVMTSDDSHNSFYVNFDNTGQKTWDINYNSLPGQFNIWYEDEIRARGSGNQATPEFNPLIVNLNAGPHTIEISGRESNAQLDYLYLVDMNAPLNTE